MKSFAAGIAHDSLVCAQCGYCQAACPVFAELGWESTGPRGRMATARLAADGKPLGHDEAQRIYECTLCGACREVCSTRIDTVATWFELRERAASAGALQGRPLAALRDNLTGSGSITGEPAESRLLWRDDLETPIAGLEPHAGAEYLYFLGCVTSLYPQGQAIAQSMVQIMDGAGVNFTTLGSAERCCAFPLLAMGLPGEAATVARQNVDAVATLYPQALVASCPSCYHMWRDVYPELLGMPLPFRVVHATEMLAGFLAAGRVQPEPLDQRVTYHDPCDLGRNSGIYEEPRALLRAIPGLELVEMEDNRERALCCGGGGNMEAVNAGLVAAIADRRARQAIDTGARILVTPCQQCKRTLAAALRREKSRMKVMDPGELLWSVVGR